MTSIGGLSMISSRLISFPSLSVPIVHTERLLWNIFAWTEHHQKFVVNAPRSISGKSGGSVNIKSGDCFDQPDCSDGNQIFEIFTCILIFFCNMSDQTKVMFNKNTFCFRIPFPGSVWGRAFPLRKSKVLRMFSNVHLKGDFYIVYVTDKFAVLFPENKKIMKQ